MPNYLVHQTRAGEPAGVFAENFDYYDEAHIHLRPAGREVVYSKLPSAPWGEFIERLASTTPSRTMQWDTYDDASFNLQLVFEHVRRDTITLQELDDKYTIVR